MCARRKVVFSLYCGLMFLLNCLFHSLDGSDYLMINIGMYYLMINDGMYYLMINDGMYCLMINDVLVTS